MTLPPVVVEVEVPLAPPDAFALFTEQIGTWWPLSTHSVFGGSAASVRFPQHSGAAIVEVSATGEESAWGTVREHDAPHRVAFSWHPGRGADTAQDVEVTFTPIVGGTAVRLSHTGWEAAGRRADEIRDNYATGWVAVLDQFTAAVAHRH